MIKKYPLLAKFESKILAAISILLAINLVLLSNRKSLYSIFADNQNPKVFYFLFLALFSFAGFIFASSYKKGSANQLIKKVYLFLLPFEICLVVSLYSWKPQLNVLFYFFAAIYIFSGLFFILRKKNNAKNPSLKSWVAEQSRANLILLLFIMIISFSFGAYRITKFSAVDEPLWTFDRVPSYWKNIKQMNWNNTNISDKPGITVAIISGVGLLDVNPKLYDPKNESSGNLNPEEMNLALRLPLLIFAILSLPLFYYLLSYFIGSRAALLSVSFIGLSPILLGMSRIINPDALLWIFAPLSLISFLVYQKNGFSKFLYLAAIFLGLSILTKYVANILYVFFFGLIFIQYIFNQEDYKNLTLNKYLLSSLRDLTLVVIISLATFYLLYPGTWLKPERLFTGTILSQAFVSTWPLFAAFLLLLMVDIISLKNKLASSFLNFFAKNKKLLISVFSALFLFAIFFVFTNTYLQMSFLNFEEILASPKTSFKENGFWGIFISNFYPLIFGIAPLAVISTIAISVQQLFIKRNEKLNNNSNVILILILFIFAYYLGTTVNNVASTTRYQIILYPLIFTIAGISLAYFYDKFEKKIKLNKKYFSFFAFGIILILAYSLFQAKPFYLSYASKLLPKNNFIDLKDMGPGSYEVAQYLNSLPNAEDISIWTDKKGICVFFKGSCYGDLSYEELKDVKIDYVAVSWGRETRTKTMVRSQAKLTSNEILNFGKYYDQEENVVFKLLIHDRPEQYIKVIKIAN